MCIRDSDTTTATAPSEAVAFDRTTVTALSEAVVFGMIQLLMNTDRWTSWFVVVIALVISILSLFIYPSMVLVVSALV